MGDLINLSLIGCMTPSVPYHNVVMDIISYSGFIGNKKIYSGVEPKYIVCVFCLLFFLWEGDDSRVATQGSGRLASPPKKGKATSWFRGRDPCYPSIPPKGEE